MLVSNSHPYRCSDHWKLKKEPEKTTYEYINYKLSSTIHIQQIVVHESYMLDKIIIIGQKIPVLYEEIKSTADSNDANIFDRSITLIESKIWIYCNQPNLKFGLKGLLDKVYAIIQREMPHFSEITQMINDTIDSLGLKRGFSYFIIKEPEQKINMYSDHWSLKSEPNKTIFEYVDSESSSKTTLIRKVVIDENFSSDIIILAGQKIPYLYKEIESNIDIKYTDILYGSVRSLVNEIWVNCEVMQRRYPGELEGLLNKIFSIIQTEMPHFSEISEKIASTMEDLCERRNSAKLKLINKNLSKTKEKRSSSDFYLKGDSSEQILDDIPDNEEKGVIKVFESEKMKKYRINGRLWVQELVNSPQSGFFNNYSSTTQHGSSSSSTTYTTLSRGDGKINYMAIEDEEIYYPLEDKVVNIQSLLVKSGNKTIYYQKDSHDIKRTLYSFVEKRLLAQEFVELFF